MPTLLSSAGLEPGPARVLVVDDEPRNRKLLAAVIGRDGHDVETAAGGAEALDLLDDPDVAPFDVVLLDLMMPDIDGLAVLRELGDRGRLPALPVVVVTAMDDRETRRRALSLGAIDFLHKPVDRAEVQCKVRSLSELSRLRAQEVRRVARHATDLTLNRVEAALSGLPLVVYELRTRDCDDPQRSWVLGDLQDAFGMRPETLLDGEAWRQRIHADDRSAADGRLAVATARPGTVHTGRLRLDVGGTWRWCNHALCVDPETGCLRGALLDAEESVQLERQLQQARKMEAVGQLAGGVAHDFNNLLGVIVSYANLAMESLPLGSGAREDLSEVISASDRASALTRQLLTFSHQAPVSPRAVDLNQHLRALRRLLEKSVTERVRLELELADHPAVIEIDPVQVDQVMLNLAVNARDAMEGGDGRLRVSVETLPAGVFSPRDVETVRVRVSDTGCGMDNETMSRIFEPFFTTKGSEQGTGLGLATCLGIVQSASGTLDVESVIGVGTTFTMEFPFCGVEEDTDRVQVAVAPVGRGELVLLAEDDDALRRVMARALERAGFRVRAAENGREAMRLLDELGDEVQVVFADMVMPDASGLDVVHHARRVAPSAAAVLTTGYGDASVDGLDIPILRKPSPMQAVVAAVASAIQRAPAVEAAPSGGPPRVLLVDDEVALCLALKRSVEGLGYECQTAHSLAAASELLDAGPLPDLLLCDLDLPDGSGAGMLEWVRDRWPTLAERSWAMTGGVTRPEVASILREGGFGLLRKPIRPRDLVAAFGRASEPTHAPTASLALPRLPRESVGPDAHILMVDDDGVGRSAWASGLRRRGFEVAEADSLRAALARLTHDEFDAVVTDVDLGDGSGVEILRAVRDIDPSLPVVLITGGTSWQDAARAIRLQASDYLTKPFAPAELSEVLDRVLTRRRSERLRGQLLAARYGGDELIRDPARTEALFESALAGLHMHFQPIVRSRDGSIYAYEALLRSREAGLMPPTRLLAAAEILDRIEDVGHAVRSAVARAAQAHPGLRARLFVNLHPSELLGEALTHPHQPLAPLANRVVFEVTERAGLEPGPRLNRALRRLRAQGYELAVDDLGEGYAGLTSLVALRPEYAKLDMSLVRDVERSPLKRDIVAGMVDVAHRSGIAVVAEGVETAAELQAVRELGVDLVQGYLLARPSPSLTAEVRWDAGATPGPARRDAPAG